MFDQYCVVPVHAGSDWGTVGHDPTYHQVPVAAPLWPLSAAGKRPTTLPWAHVACETLSKGLTQWSKRVSKLLTQHWGHIFFLSFYQKITLTRLLYCVISWQQVHLQFISYFTSYARRLKGSGSVWKLQWSVCQHCLREENMRKRSWNRCMDTVENES